jgi:hypothetical protein
MAAGTLTGGTIPARQSEPKPKAPPALRVARKLTRPERQQKLEQHLEEQLERINGTSEPRIRCRFDQSPFRPKNVLQIFISEMRATFHSKTIDNDVCRYTM